MKLKEPRGVSLTAEIQGTSSSPTVLVHETYRFILPRHMIATLEEEVQERLLKALDLQLPVLCMAIIEADGSKLYEICRVFFPKETLESLP